MYAKTAKAIWEGRVDTRDQRLGKRWHQMIQMIDLKTESLPRLPPEARGVVFLGVSSHEGVRRNQGRIGAAEGPQVLRSACASHPWHFRDEALFLFDGGTIFCLDGNLEKSQALQRQYIAQILSAGYFPFVFGGGHEIALGSYSGITDGLPDQQVGIINIDAHFDMRLPENGASSGTPFLQIAHWCQVNQHPFNYLCLGIQEQSNTKALFKTAADFDVKFLTVDEIDTLSPLALSEKLDAFIAAQDLIHLTICLDVFSAAYAPGVSAPNANGLIPKQVIRLLRDISASGKVVVCDIAELNPVYDIDNRTAKLAAFLSYEILNQLFPEAKHK